MAKRRRVTRKTTKRRNSSVSATRKRTYRGKKNFVLELDSKVAKEIWAVWYGALAILTILSIRGELGKFGDFWTEILTPLFGYGIYFIPAILLILSLSLFLFKKFNIDTTKTVGLVLLIVSSLGIIHLSVPEYDIYDLAAAGQYGGLVGFVSSFGFRFVLGIPGAYVVLFSLFLVSMLMTFEVSLLNLFSFFKIFFAIKPVKKKRKRLDVKNMKDLKKEMEMHQELNIVKPEIGKVEEKVLDLREEENDKKNKSSSEEMKFEREQNSDRDFSKDSGDDFAVEEMEFDWEFPPYDLLSNSTLAIELNDKLLKKNAEIIKSKLSQFGIDVAMHDVHVGPTVMQYTLSPHAAVKLSKITALKNDLALALAAKAVRIEAPIPGKSLVGIEIPNEIRSTVHLREILESREFKEYKGVIKLPLGRDVSGSPVIASLEKMPHLLIAGATGSGKSVAINTILLSLFYQFSPKDLRLILIDPKRVELNNYNAIPHLLTPVVTDVEKAVIGLRWAVKEMTRRYNICAESGHRSALEYNADPKIREKLPYIVIIIDEMADLMMTTGKEVEASICRLAQMARAVGIHLILATQRPSVDVITGLIKANIPARIAFTMSSSIDSRTVLDMMGAEDLLGHGDMLFLSGTMSKTTRVQGVFVSSNEIEKVTNKMKLMPSMQYDESITSEDVANESVQGLPDSAISNASSASNSDDPLYQEALTLIMSHRKASASLLQRRLSIGYARAARLLDLLEENGIIGPSNGAKPREILMSGSVES